MPTVALRRLRKTVQFSAVSECAHAPCLDDGLDLGDLHTDLTPSSSMASTPNYIAPSPRSPLLAFEEFVLCSEDTPTIAIYSSHIPVIDIDTGVVLNAPTLIPALQYATCVAAQHEQFLRPYVPHWERVQRRGEDTLHHFYTLVTHAVLHTYGWNTPFCRDLVPRSPPLSSSWLSSPPPRPPGMTKGVEMEITNEVYQVRSARLYDTT